MVTRAKATAGLSGNASRSAAGHRASLRLTIDGVEYAVKPVARPDLPRLARRGFRLSRPDRAGGRVVHVVTAGPLGLSCTCLSVFYRSGPAALDSGRCKHQRALAALGMLP